MSEEMSGITPGPWVWLWKFKSLHQVRVRVALVERLYGRIVLFPTYGGDEGVSFDVDDADARLIEAAPDLLEALIDVVAAADRKTDVFDRAHAAITKALVGSPI